MGRLPARRKGSKLAQAMPEGVRKAEESFYRCPKGHGLPHRTNRGECTPLFCAADAAEAAPEPSKALAKVREPRHKDEGDEREDSRIERAKGRELARRKFLAVPDGLAGQEAENWVEAKLRELSPLAIAEVEYQLRLGDDDRRYKAAQDVLNATGHGKKDSTGGAQVINIIGGSFQLPWNNKKTEPIGAIPANVTVDAKK